MKKLHYDDIDIQYQNQNFAINLWIHNSSEEWLAYWLICLCFNEQKGILGLK